MNLFPYQEAGVEFLRGRNRRYLADEMGLGKTVQALRALDDVQSITVVCPAAAVGNWYREHEKWGAPRQYIQCVSYASLHKVDAHSEAVVLDEAHYTKNHKAKRTKKALSLAARAKRAVLLSGTPMPNHPGELFTMFKYLWPELLSDHNRTYYKWLNRYCKVRPTGFGPKVYGFQRAPELKELLSRVMLRRKLADVRLDLPPLRVTAHHLRVPHKSFEDMLKEDGGEEAMLAALDAEKEDPSVSRIRRLIGEWKAPHIAEVLANELEDNQYGKIVVLYHHRSVGDIYEGVLGKFGVVRLDGKTPATRRQPIVDEFNSDPKVRIFLGQQMAAGEALNLQAASEVALVEPAWTPDANRQAIKRVHRIGQEHPCRARVFCVEKTVDVKVMETIAEKTETQTAVGLR